MGDIKEFLTGIIVRWVLKLGGVWLISIGVDEATIWGVIGGIIAILIGMIMTLFQTKKAVDKPVK